MNVFRRIFGGGTTAKSKSEAQIGQDTSNTDHAARKELEDRFRWHYQNATGSELHRNAIAIAMMELEDPWVSQAAALYTVEERPIFLMAYQCFLVWELAHVLKDRLQGQELQELVKNVYAAFATCACHNPEVFKKILAFTQQFMPLALQGGSQTGVVYPLPMIIEAATAAGYPLPQKILDYRSGLHVIVVMKRIAETLAT